MKTTATGGVDPDLRNEQFENIEKLRAQYEKQGFPVLSVDTKKKEFLGGLHRDGEFYSQTVCHSNGSTTIFLIWQKAGWCLTGYSISTSTKDSSP